MTKKRMMSFEHAYNMHHCSTIPSLSLVEKKEDLGAFTISCTIGPYHFDKVLCDLGSNINLCCFLSLKNRVREPLN